MSENWGNQNFPIKICVVSSKNNISNVKSIFKPSLQRSKRHVFWNLSLSRHLALRSRPSFYTIISGTHRPIRNNQPEVLTGSSTAIKNVGNAILRRFPIDQYLDRCDRKVICKPEVTSRPEVKAEIIFELHQK